MKIGTIITTSVMVALFSVLIFVGNLALNDQLEYDAKMAECMAMPRCDKYFCASNLTSVYDQKMDYLMLYETCEAGGNKQ